jgi:nuclear pore complex protein Nup133
VRNGPTNDFGVLAVAASSGKITFWDNVDHVEATSHFSQRQQGIDGSAKLYSGELVTGLVDVELAGYVLILSSGRLVQVILRDSQGRPSISTNVLQAPTGSGGSFFSFKGLLGGASRKTIASVKARPSQSKGQMELITATKNGLFQVWELSWSGQQIFQNQIDVYASILAAIQGGTPPESRGQQEAHVLDFAIVNHQRTPGAVGLFVLVALTGQDLLEYSLLEVDLSDTTGIVSRAIPIRTFQQDPSPAEPKGTLLVPAAGHTAFVQFPGAIVVASLVEPEVSPDAQLLADSGGSSSPFQDTVYLRDDRHLNFCGHALEPLVKKDGMSRALIFVQGYGILRISALPPNGTENFKVTAMNKLEQATFYSKLADNILDFSVKSRYAFAQEDVEEAAVVISTNILSSSYAHLEKVTSSVEDHFRQRAFALRTLITHLQAEYGPLSYRTRWELMWRAEKLAGAQAIWTEYQTKAQDRKAHPEAYTTPPLIPDMVMEVYERYKSTVRPDAGETESVRHFFIKDVNNLDILLPWAWQDLRTLWLQNQSKSRPEILQRLSDGYDVMLAALETALEFRQEHLELYGFDPAAFFTGILRPDTGQDMLPQFWTSTHNMVASVRSLVDIGRSLANESFDNGGQQGALAVKIASDNPRLVKLCCHVHMERFTWAHDQSNEKKREMGKNLREEFIKIVRPEQICGLSAIGQAYEGMKLAELYHDMPTLARLIWEETQYIHDEKETTSSRMEQAECVDKLNRMKERIHGYFEKFPSWADAFYSKFITERRSGQLFDKDFLNQPALTKFLRGGRFRLRLTWINEVEGEKNYGYAHKALIETATAQETNTWCKKVELSIAKLSLLAKQQVDSAAGQKPEAKAILERNMAYTDGQLEYAKIQELLYERFLPTISEALDDESAVQLLMDRYAQGRLVERPAHQQLLKQGFEDLIQHRVLDDSLLIDVLTLTACDDNTSATELVQFNGFALALKAIRLSRNWNDVRESTRMNTLKLVWKRILIQDSWAEMNNTRDLSDAHIGDVLANTVAGLTWKEYNKLISKSSSRQEPGQEVLTTGAVEDKSYRGLWPMPPNELLGAGCTNGELCVRFASEDLRNPIIADNLADDEVLQANIEKHRLEAWFPAAMKAAKASLAAEERQAQAPVAESDDSDSVEGFEDGGGEENADAGAGDAETGDVETAAQDVEMQD